MRGGAWEEVAGGAREWGSRWESCGGGGGAAERSGAEESGEEFA
jgi:hypothetical protein